MSIKTEKEELQKDLVLLKVEVPVEQVEVALKRAYNTVANKMNVPGFRRGKVPNELIDQRFGKEFVFQEMLDASVPLFYKEAVRQAGINPIDKAEIEMKSGTGGVVLFEAKVPVTPRPALCDYKAIVIEKPTIAITEDDVQKKIEELRDKYARFESVSDRGVEENDFMLIDMEMLLADTEKPVKDASVTDYLLDVGKNQIGLDVEMKLIGMKKGETRDVIIDMPSDADQAEIAGKAVIYRVKAKDVKSRVRPELNDEFAQSVSEFDTFAELKEDIEKKLIEKKEKKVRDEADQAVLERIIEQSKIDVPEILIEHRVNNMMKMFEESLNGRGLTVDEYVEQTKMSINDIRDDYEKAAINHLKTDIVLREVAELENIKITDEDVDLELKKYADSIGREFTHVKREFAASERLDEIQENIAAARALDFLSGNTSIKYVDGLVEEGPDAGPAFDDMLAGVSDFEGELAAEDDDAKVSDAKVSDAKVSETKVSET